MTIALGPHLPTYGSLGVYIYIAMISVIMVNLGCLPFLSW